VDVVGYPGNAKIIIFASIVKWEKSILQILNVRKDESWLVGQLFMLQFFQGAGVALFFTVSNALFLERYEVHELPKVYLIAAILLLDVGFIYSKLEHALSVRRMTATVIIFMTVTVGLFGVFVSESPPGWFLYLMVAWYYILYLLSNLEFWGLSALLFDIRQSKRLFGIISAGDIPAKILGYFSAYVIVLYTGSANMIFISMASIGASLIFWYRLAKAGKLDLHVDHHEEHKRENEIEPSVMKMISGFFGSNLIMSVAILSFIVVTVNTIINFTFYAEVKHRIHDNEHLAAFIGLFFACGNIVALFIKLVMTGKLTDAIGIRGSLLLTPLLLLLPIFAVTLSPALSEDSTIIIYVLGIMGIFSQTLKAAIQDPVFIAVMQPLKRSLRLRGHTIVKGVMDPFALAFGSILIFIVMRFSGGVNLHVLSYLLIVMIVGWIAWVFIVDKNYVSSLIDGLNNRYMSGKEIDLSKDTTVELLFAKIPHAKVGEAIYLMELAAKLPDEKKDEMIRMGLKHTDEDVKLEAIKIVESKKIRSVLPELLAILSGHPSQRVMAQAIQAVCIIQHEEDVEDFSTYLDSPDISIVKASVVGLLKNGSINAVVSAGQKLQQLRDSEVVEERAVAAEVIGELRVKSFYKVLLNLLDDPHDMVVSAAIEASGKLQSGKLVKGFIEKIYDKRYERKVLQALLDAGDTAIDTISEIIFQPSLSKDLCIKLIHTTGKIGGESAHALLIQCIKLLPDYRTDIYQALHTSRFRVREENNSDFHKLINTDVSFGIHLLGQMYWLQQHHKDEALERALLLELNQAKTRLLWLFSFIYEEEKIIRAKNGFQINKQESIANAQEIIDIMVPKDISSKFNILFEQASVAERVVMLKTSIVKHTDTFGQLAREVLTSEYFNYNLWTRAVILYSMNAREIKENIDYVQANIHSADFLLRETGENALKKLAVTI
jgi:AAA family ATP:ADP antiporter